MVGKVSKGRRNANVDRYRNRDEFVEPRERTTQYPPTPAFGSVKVFSKPLPTNDTKHAVLSTIGFKRKREHTSKQVCRKKANREANWYYENILGIDRREYTSTEKVRAYKRKRDHHDDSMIKEHVEKWRRLQSLPRLVVGSGVHGKVSRKVVGGESHFMYE